MMKIMSDISTSFPRSLPLSNQKLFCQLPQIVQIHIYGSTQIILFITSTVWKTFPLKNRFVLEDWTGHLFNTTFTNTYIHKHLRCEAIGFQISYFFRLTVKLLLENMLLVAWKVKLEILDSLWKTMHINCARRIHLLDLVYYILLFKCWSESNFSGNSIYT